MKLLSRIGKSLPTFGEILLQEDFYPPIFVSRNLNRYDYESEKIFHGTDRMAFELSLTQTQYNDLYEVNYDFFSGIDPYVSAMARQEAYALDAYYRYLDERNDDLRWVLSSAEYVRFMALEYFFRPVYILNRVCSLRIYQVYPNRTFFYFGRPAHYLTYCGGHSRRHLGGRSFYRARHPKVYRHPVYAGSFHSRPDFRKHDFAPGRPPQKGPGYHFTPARPSRPEAGPAHKPGKRPAVGSRKPVRVRTGMFRKKEKADICVEPEDDVSLAWMFLWLCAIIQ